MVFFLPGSGVLANSDGMNTKAADWRADPDASRDLNDEEKQGFGFLVSWFESWRMTCCETQQSRPAARRGSHGRAGPLNLILQAARPFGWRTISRNTRWIGSCGNCCLLKLSFGLAWTGEPGLVALADPLPYVRSGGLQRRNSTICYDAFNLKSVNFDVGRASEQPRTLCTSGLW